MEGCRKPTADGGIEAILRYWSKPGRPHIDSDLALLQKVCEVMRHYMAMQQRSFFTNHPDEDVVIHGSGDGTPLSHRINIIVTANGNTVRRSGKSGGEFYVKNCFTFFRTTFGKLLVKPNLDLPAKDDEWHRPPCGGRFHP